MDKITKSTEKKEELKAPEGEIVSDLLLEILEKQNEIIDWINNQ